MSEPVRVFRVQPESVPEKPKTPPTYYVATVNPPANDGNWVPGCGQTETEFRTRSGFRLLYCYNAVQHKHAYLNLDTDMLMTDEEARMAIGLY
jgi:hypothetical protein